MVGILCWWRNNNGALSRKKRAQAIYQLNSMDEIKKWCEDNQKELWEYVVECEGKEIFAGWKGWEK